MAQEVGAAQLEAQDVRRAARSEAVQLVVDARAEANRVREQAKAVLAEARAEADAVARRRDPLTGELAGGLEDLAAPGGHRPAGLRVVTAPLR
ncbi:MAG: hypothetical protein AVDCRST_MAG35-1883 [uncultured Quadrisphaera sp.]|uniref:Uncharacterized protein n=1 Tax=uncultured Quadrisphaera sp. TaxID=904978 RepID=A0A6J4PTH0_9ACTN|nr:MAG: hypothetical protein AVDCRST_MAG35-1883 [uncultured Quadrisphaera sp.]